MFRRFFAWVSKNERHVSAVAMVAGFIIDQIFFGAVNLLRTQAVFIAYILICVISIALLQIIERRAESGKPRPRWRSALPIAIQFALGGFWSGFLVFYGRSAAISASWPFLALLIIILIANEILRKYHDRLIFTNVLFFFALFSYVIFALPIFTGTLGTQTFLESGLLALGAFALFQLVLFTLGRARYRSAARSIVFGTLGVYLLINIFYFTSILPPLPLSLKAAGIYHSITHTPPLYTAIAEQEPWPVRFGLEEPTMHVVVGESLYAYSAVFTPITLTTVITDRWEWYNPTQGEWITEARIAYPIEGGRLAGYDGYSTVENLTPGQWRVDVETIDGRIIGRIPFTVVLVSEPPSEYSKILN
jgi:hypothetical protein